MIGMVIMSYKNKRKRLRIKNRKQFLLPLQIRSINLIQKQHGSVVVFFEDIHRGLAFDDIGCPACTQALLLEVADEELDAVIGKHAANVFRIDYRSGLNSFDFVFHDITFLMMLQS